VQKPTIEAYGFHLSPLALRCDEFVRLAAEAKIGRERKDGLHKRLTVAHRAVRQAEETVASPARFLDTPEGRTGQRAPDAQ
jgi:hypothetical protein